MKFTSILLLLAIVAGAFAEKTPPKTLQIGVKFKPTVCERTTRAGYANQYAR